MAEHHPQQEVSDAIQHALDLGWRVIRGTGHCYATLRCPQHDRSGCQVRVASTPQNAGNHARRIVREIDRCMHLRQENEE
jgi:FAD/FMN-containing dehydrogenase